MTTRSAKLYQGEDKSPVYDYTDLVIWEESEFGTRAWQGEGSASSIVIRDPLGEQGNELLLPAGLSRKSLAAKNLFVVEVDSSTLFRGRVGIKNYSRDNQHVERYRQVECSLHDTNWDLDHIFVHQYSRPLETDKARAQGLIASYLSASPRATTVLNGSNYISGSNLVTLPAQTYNRTSPLGVLREVAGTANKQFFVTGDAIGGGSLFYDGNDSTAYACTFTISDRESEVRAAPTTTFPPIWNVGPASVEDGSELTSHIRLFYGVDEDSYVTASSAIVQSQYSHASETITDDTVTDAANAQSKANARLAHRQYEDKNYNVTIGPLTDAQVVLVKHGQTIEIKARAIPDADDQLRLMRIVQCRYTTPIAGTWFAHLQLGRPWKMGPYGTGPVLIPQPPDEGTAGTAPTVTASGGATSSAGYDSILVSVGAAQGGLYLAWLTHNGLTARSARYQYNGSDAGTSVAMTLIGTIEHSTPSNGTNTDNDTIYIFHKANPTASINSGFCEVDFTGTQNGGGLGWWVVDSAAVPVVATAQGAGTRSSVTPSAGADDLVLDTTGWRVWSLGDASNTPTLGSGQTSDWAIAYNHSAGQPDGAWAGGHKVGAGAREWSWATSTNWVAATITIPGTGTAGDFIGSVGGTGEGAVGDADKYIPVGSVLEHNNITEGGPYHEAADVTFTPTGTISSTNVQDAIVEAAGGGLDWFDVTAYGATGDGVTDDTAEINLAIAALNAAGGGVLYFPATSDSYLTSGALTSITIPAIVRGDGMRSKIVCSSATANLFMSASHEVHYRDLFLDNSATTPTAGAAIRVTSGNLARYTNLVITDFWIGIDHEDGIGWTMDHLYIESVRKYGIQIANVAVPDNGDWAIDNTVISDANARSADAAIRIESSGGGKITNLKVNGTAATGYNHGIDLAIPTATATSIFLVANSSIENIRDDAVHVTTTGAGLWPHLKFEGNQFGLYSNNAGYAISLVAASTGKLDEVVIANNIMHTDGTARSGVELVNIDNVVFGGNVLSGFDDLYDATTSTNITVLGAGAGYDEGTSFPGSPASGDKFFHNTYDMLFQYDGTRWVCTCPHQMVMAGAGTDVVANTTNNVLGTRMFLSGADDLYLDKMTVGTRVITTNNGTHHWSIQLVKVAPGGSEAVVLTRLTNGDTVGNWSAADVSIGAVLDVSAHPLLYTYYTKAGTPGAIDGNNVLHYRVIGV